MNILQAIRRAFSPALSGAPLSLLAPSYFAPSFATTWLGNLRETRDCESSLLAFSAVWSCVSIISGDVAKLPVNVIRTLANGARERMPAHPVARLLNRPNDYQTRADMMQQAMSSLLLAGNAYLYKARDAAGAVRELHVVDPARVRVLVDDAGAAYYEVNSPKSTVTLPATEICHHRTFVASHPLSGISPLYAAGTSAAVGASINMQSRQFFANAARPSGVLKSPGKISRETATTLKEQWVRNYTGAHVGSPAVLSEGLSWESMTMSAIDAQLIEQLKFSIEDVARAFKIPMFLLGDMTKATYRNAEGLMRLYYTGCLQSHLESLELRLDRDLDLGENEEVEFDLDVLLRADSETRFQTYRTAIMSGILTVNEARKAEGRAPVEGGDQVFIQSQNIPLADAAKGVTTPAAA